MKCCPNPECKSEDILSRGGPWNCWLECNNDECQLSGPVGETEAEAIRLWDLLLRREDIAAAINKTYRQCEKDARKSN